jgi:hypothetical protein
MIDSAKAQSACDFGQAGPAAPAISIRNNAQSLRWHRGREIAWLCAFGIALLALRIALVLMYAKSLPFWDEWGAIINFLAHRYTAGVLSPLDLFHAHNEHTIFFTYLAALCELSLNHGQFDNLPIVLFNAVFFAGTWLFIIYCFSKDQPGPSPAPLIALGFAALAPVGWENIITGFQNQFAFLVLGAALCFWRAADRTSLSYRGIAGVIVISFGACVTMGSGFLSPFAAFAICLLRAMHEKAQRRTHLLHGAIFAAATAFGFFLLIRAQAHSVAPSAFQFIARLLSLLARPYGISAIAGIVVSLPMCLLGLSLLRRGGNRTDYFAFGLGSWCAMQACAIALGREVEPLASRYLDVLVFWPLMNLYALARLVGRDGEHVLFRYSAFVIPTIATAVFIGMMAGSVPESLSALQWRSDRFGEQTLRVAHYVRTGDASVLAVNGFLDLPYPNGTQLKAMLDDPIVRQSLPPDVRAPLDLAPQLPMSSPFVPNGFYPTTPALDGIRNYGSYNTTGDAAVGTFLSKPMHTDFPYVQTSVAGYLSKPGLSLLLACYAQSDCAAIHFTPSQPAGESWQDIFAKVQNDGVFRIAAEDNSPTTWFAFSAPREAGALSVKSEELRVYLQNTWRKATEIIFGSIALLLFFGYQCHTMLLCRENNR